MLLAHVRGATSFIDVRTINGKVYETFKEACNALGLIRNDREWHEAMDEAVLWATSAELRQLFVTMLLFCQVVDPKKIFDGNSFNMRDDILYKMSKALSVSSVSLSDENMRNLLLMELDKMLKKCGSSLYDNKLPEPTAMKERDMENALLRDELAHDTGNLANENLVLIGQLNEEQRIVYDEVLAAVYEMQVGLFFLYGDEGIGKKFVYKAIISRLRSEGKIVIAVASSGIASLLLPSG